MPPTRDWFDGNGRLAKRVKNFGSTDPAPQANYYLRSSVTGAVLTETDYTGRKLKTFVPANGATLAEQEMARIGGTTTEKLTFIHQDPSLASLERTDRNGNVANLRAGEYDALGRNVADAGPYVTFDTSPPAGDQGSSGINLDGSAQGYRPGRMNYFADGLPVPEDYVRDLFNSGRIGGVFGVVEATVRISNTAGEWIDTDGPCTLANGAEIRVGVATHLFLLGSSWGPSGLIGDLAAQADQSVALRLSNEQTESLKAAMHGALINKDGCEGFIKNLITKMGEMSGNRVISNDIVKLFDLVASSRGNNSSWMGGIWITIGDSSWGGYAQNYWDWINGPGFANVHLFAGGAAQFFEPGWKERWSEEQKATAIKRATDYFFSTPNEGGMTVIHELIHVAVADWGDDVEISMAVAELLGVKTPVYEGERLNERYSIWWNGNLKEKCGF